jgi:signal transduction histidine kinase
VDETLRDSGVLPVFRLFAILWLVLFLLGGGAHLVWDAFSSEARLFFGIGLANALLLLGYLLWPWLWRVLGRAYLLIGLLIATAGPILVNHLVTLLNLDIGALAHFDVWPLAAILFVPLVIVAWQHPLRDVILFCLGTALLDMLLAALAARGDSKALFTAAHEIFGRTGSLLLVGAMVSRVVSIQRRQSRSLAEANARLTHYAATLDQLATSRERNRLARELHDTIAHTLSGLSLELEAVDSLWELEPARARTLLRASLAAARSGLTETRRALKDLRSSPLEDLGLALAVRQAAESAAARAGLSLELAIPEEVGSLPPAVEQGVYRIVQEALANVVHHAGAQRVSVSLVREGKALVVTVADDGRGFDPAAIDAESHLGLRGMRERAEVAGGTLAVESVPGEGTRVALRVPGGRGE